MEERGRIETILEILETPRQYVLLTAQEKVAKITGHKLYMYSDVTSAGKKKGFLS